MYLLNAYQSKKWNQTSPAEQFLQEWHYLLLCWQWLVVFQQCIMHSVAFSKFPVNAGHSYHSTMVKDTYARVLNFMENKKFNDSCIDFAQRQGNVDTWCNSWQKIMQSAVKQSLLVCHPICEMTLWKLMIMKSQNKLKWAYEQPLSSQKATNALIRQE